MGSFCKRNSFLTLLLLGGLLSFFLSGCSIERQSEGKRLYDEKCLNCHQENGAGLNKLIPSLTDRQFLQNNRSRLVCIIANGLSDTITINGIQYSEKMKGVEGLEPVDITNILNYIGQNWGNDLETFTIAEVSVQLNNCSSGNHK